MEALTTKLLVVLTLTDLPAPLNVIPADKLALLLVAISVNEPPVVELVTALFTLTAPLDASTITLRLEVNAFDKSVVFNVDAAADGTYQIPSSNRAPVVDVAVEIVTEVGNVRTVTY